MAFAPFADSANTANAAQNVEMRIMIRSNAYLKVI
jgi:hypothetical protein